MRGSSYSRPKRGWQEGQPYVGRVLDGGLATRYREECEAKGHGQPDGMPAIPAWTVESHLEFMKQNNISKCILSISSPGINLVASAGSQPAAELAAYCNDFAADLKRQHPDHFGFWASLPLPDVGMTLKEIARAEELGADGFCLLTNTHGRYLGDPAFKPVFAELNRRKATLFIHPTTPCTACQSGADSDGMPARATPLMHQFPSPVFEFLLDTARSFAYLLLSGTLHENLDIRVVVPHLGGAMPPILTRVVGFSAIIPGTTRMDMGEVMDMIRKQVYFDLAGFAVPGQFTGLVDGLGIPLDRLLYGSDYPFTPAPIVERLAAELDVAISDRFGVAALEQICSSNAEGLLKDNL
ncbi:hypothetical protein BDV11DRAFT_200988 [Aspergillus similis]